MKNQWKNQYQSFVRFIAMSLCLYPLNAFAKGVLGGIFSRILRFSGLMVLNRENFFKLVEHPMAILALLGFFLVVCALIFSEFSLLLYSVQDELHWESLRSFFKERIVKKWSQLFSLEIGFFLLYLLLMIPLANLGLHSTILAKFKIPDFIGEELMKSYSGFCLYVLFQGFIAYANIRLIYFLPFFALTERGLKASFLGSLEETKLKTGQTIWRIFKLVLLSTIVSLVMTFGMAYLFSKLDPSGHSLVKESIFYSILTGTHFAMHELVKFGLIYFMAKRIQRSVDPGRQRRPFYRNIRYWIMAVAFVLVTVMNTSQLASLEENTEIEKISHRGESREALENTIEALQLAHEQGADYVEMDVMMTKDKQLVVFHDESLKRLSARKEKVADLNLEEIQSTIFSNENGIQGRVPTLQEYLMEANRLHQPLLIELKAYHHDPKEFYEWFKQVYESVPSSLKHKIISLDLNLLKKWKNDHPHQEVGYIIPIQWGPLLDLPVDFYVVEEFSYNSLLSLSANQQGKDVYVWTINKESEMERLVYSAAKGILTDDVPTLNWVLSSLKNPSYFERALNLLDMKD